MAGDWMKIELELPDKPEVHAMAGMLNIDSDAVVGKLIRVWQWFDKHTTDGNAYGVTYSLLDRITNVTGFSESMVLVGWLEQKDKILHMPKFDRHTSASAKTRASTAKRVAKSRNADTVTETLLEKRREEKNLTPIVANDKFDDFWNAWPSSKRKVAKEECHKKWKANKLDSLAEVIITHVKLMKLTQQWKEGFDPAPLTYINQKRWSDDVYQGETTGEEDWFAKAKREGKVL
jgi:hypothetical protein